ncbi:MAG: gliding motility lipoprotein GldH [Flavobacteriales bacterium]|nr:gliding motility lipoprotein GldH [Flavobacteriales bacterium]
MRSFQFGILVLLGIMTISCSDPNIVTEETRPLSGQVWNADDTIGFEFDVEDTIGYFDFYLNLRITTSYNYSNCYVFTTLESPDMFAADTINIPLADPSSGRWLGDESGSMVENHVLFMKNVRFHELGKYKIKFVQGMRDVGLTEISDVGLTIKKAN